MIRIRIPRIQTWTVVGFRDSRIAIAGSRAGGFGVLDLPTGFDPREASRLLTEAARLLKKKVFGVRVDLTDLQREWLTEAPAQLAGVIVATERDWAGARRAIDESGRIAIADARSLEQALSAVEAGFSHLVLSGNDAGGRVADESTFVFLQAVLAKVPASVRIWARGGIGPMAAAGCVAAGATGVVLDGALLACRESPLDRRTLSRIARWDGGETSVFRTTEGSCRGFIESGSPLIQRLRAPEITSEEISTALRWGEGQFWPVGQDAAYAQELALKYVTVGGIVRAVEETIDRSLSLAIETRPLAENSPMALAMGTRFPILQGPMTRVSDRPAFAKAVSDGGALPFLALALLRGEALRTLLKETSETLGECSWGVGLLGFVDPEIRREQTEAILNTRPPFVLIAGGRPDQARPFEEAGIVSYLHVPSPRLLAQFLRDGARRFILEGRECGGHVGPRSSLLLWEQAGQVVREAIDSGLEASEIQLVYAGGIHDARSAAVVAAISAPLVKRGMKAGVLIGTAYLFTKEAVSTGAIVQGFQDEAIRCSSTVLLETGPGHSVRVSPTAFVDQFEKERMRLGREGRSADAIRVALEEMNVGRLRIAAKGVDHRDGLSSPLVPLSDVEQQARGLYMLGQAAALRDRVTTVTALHEEIAQGSCDWLAGISNNSRPPRRKRSRPSDVAIIGMASLVPGAENVRAFWSNTLKGVDSITEVPSERWDWRIYYDQDQRAPDKITSRWGGFVPEIPFDPLRYGMPPTSLPSIEPLHLLTLEVVRAALDDAGYRDRPFPRERTAVILGAGGGAAQLAMGHAFRSYLPLLDTVIPGAGSEMLAKCGTVLPEWTEDSFPGILLNVAAGRVANRFDLGGANYTVDAACGSSLAAAAQAVRELETGAADMVILGGADTVQNPFTYLAFSKTHAFSPRGRCRPFDDSADGIVISEGVGVLVLKRLADAERDGDRIYAVIKGLGASSDGRAKGLTAPRFEGQVRALERAYEKSGISPASIGYVEAHGTGTAAGDLAEVSALKAVFERYVDHPEGCALGSIKSQIGHTKCAAGLAGLINAALALHHRVLPPTIGIKTPNPRAAIEGSPFHLSTQSRPWTRADPSQPRRAGVSAFGFGGTNFHAVLEAYEGNLQPVSAAIIDWPVELFLLCAPTASILAEELDWIDHALRSPNPPKLLDLSHSLSASADLSNTGLRLAIVASSIEDFREKIARARIAIAEGAAELHDASGIDYETKPSCLCGQLAFLFPGQGAQYPGMLSELAMCFPDILDGHEAFDRALAAHGKAAVTPRVFPPPVTRSDAPNAQLAALAAIDVAQPALGASSSSLLALLRKLGLRPDVTAGHSYGELVALHAASVFSRDALATLSEARGRFLLASVGSEPGGMTAVLADRGTLESILEECAEPEIVVANWNGPAQTVISGPKEALAKFDREARRRGVRTQPLNVAAAFHSPVVAGAAAPFMNAVAALVQDPPNIPVYSNVTARPYEKSMERIPGQLGDHLTNPVRFAEMIATMHEDGVRTFLEVGPNAVLTGLVDKILEGKPHVAIACDPPSRRGLAGFLSALGRLFTSGREFAYTQLTEGRGARILSREADGFASADPPLPESTWFVNGDRARPAFGPASRRFGPGPALEVTPGMKNGWQGNGHKSTNGHTWTARDGSRPARKVAHAAIGREDPVLDAYQRTMRNFLDVQRATMLAYLGGEQSAGLRALPPAPSTNGHALKKSQPVVRETTQRRESVAAATLSVEERLRAIVKERTGYPADMIGMNLDMEADLGIDSIKRVEILGTLRDSLPSAGKQSETVLMEQLARARTLGAIVERVRQFFDETENGAAKEAILKNGSPSTAPEKVRTTAPTIQRMTIRAADAPLVDSKIPRAEGLVLITDDGRGVADAVCALLEERGVSSLRIVHVADAPLNDFADTIQLDFQSLEAMEQLVDLINRRGRISGIVHALPLRALGRAGLDAARWSERIDVESRGLFLLARGLFDKLAETGNSALGIVAATALGGGFASVHEWQEDAFPGQGAVAGFVKTLAREWPEVPARVVDFDARDTPESIGARLVKELFSRDGLSEIGYLEGRRVTLEETPSPLSKSSSPRLQIREGEPILISGGGRGITAAVTADLAERWRPTLLILGSGPAPLDREDLAFHGLADPSAIKAKITDELLGQGRQVTPRDVEERYRGLMRDREIRENLRMFRQAGAVVEYEQADVRDHAQLASVLGQWRQTYGPPVGLIHGAGVIHDKLLRDKSVESFDRVVRTKLDGALNLARLVEPDALRFAAFFSSIAGRFGNRGQLDYAAANEALNKLALWLNRQWQARVVSMIWGPWSGVGMVSDLEGHLARQGLTMIPPDIGRSRLAEELMFGDKDDVEILIAGDLGDLSRKNRVGGKP